MYPMERFLGTLKSYVSNKARAEGSIAERYIAKECSDFCSRYLKGVETQANRLDRNDDGLDDLNYKGFDVFRYKGRCIGAANYDPIEQADFHKIQWYVFTNCDEIEQKLK
ncbi:unnamed protein product [Linum trigynum]|uniref:DUF4218 domain-containing protein n=1 Tax=Linum trigynum TaxID=586398 RepID=A0AAV2GKH3_9ROSI